MCTRTYSMWIRSSFVCHVYSTVHRNTMGSTIDPALTDTHASEDVVSPKRRMDRHRLIRIYGREKRKKMFDKSLHRNVPTVAATAPVCVFLILLSPSLPFFPFRPPSFSPRSRLSPSPRRNFRVV